MTRDEIVTKMLTKAPRMLFPTMSIGGNVSQLRKMEEAGLIRGQKRYLGGNRQRDWYMTHEQHAAAKARSE